MKLSEIQALLSEHGIGYIQTREPDKAEFYRKQGFRNGGGTGAFCLLTIPNSHHARNIVIVFEDDSDDPEFHDLSFGGFWYDMFGLLEEELPQCILEEVRNITSGRSWVIFTSDSKTGAWVSDALYFDSLEEEWNDMDRFRKDVEKIRKSKGLWRKLTGKVYVHEIFNWKSYEKVQR